MVEEGLTSGNRENTPLAQSLIEEGKLTAFVIFFILGIGNLLPWNAFITASTYYENRFCGTMYENSFESYFSMFYTVSQPVGLLATIYFKRHFTTKALVLYPLITYSIIFVINTILVGATSFPQAGLFAITLISTFLCGLCAAIMNGGLFGLAGILPPTYTGGIMSGQGLAGTAVSIVNLLIVGVSNSHNNCAQNSGNNNIDDDTSCSKIHELDTGALAYFIVATVTLMLCILLFQKLLLLPFVQCHMRLHLREHLLVENDTTNPLHQQSIQPSQRIPSINAATVENNTCNNNNNEKLTQNRLIENQFHEHESIASSLSSVDSHLLFPESASSSDVNANVKEQSRPQIIQLKSDFSNNDNNSKTNNYYDNSVNSNALRDLDDISLISEQHLQSENTGSHHVTVAEILEIGRFIFLPALSVFLVFAGTLAVFPSILVLIEPQHSCRASTIYHAELWVPFLFLLLNISDFSGRIVAPIVKNHVYFHYFCTPSVTFGCSIGRLCIPILFCFSHIDGSHLPMLTSNDGVTFLLTLLLGFTNGLLANLAMMQGPAIVSEKYGSLPHNNDQHKSTTNNNNNNNSNNQNTGSKVGEKASLAGTIMIFALSSGLLVGACLSFLLVYIVLGT